MCSKPRNSMSELVLSAVFYLQQKNGVSVMEIAKYVADKWCCDPCKIRKSIKVALIKAKQHGIMSESKGLYRIEGQYEDKLKKGELKPPGKKECQEETECEGFGGGDCEEEDDEDDEDDYFDECAKDPGLGKDVGRLGAGPSRVEDPREEDVGKKRQDDVDEYQDEDDDDDDEDDDDDDDEEDEEDDEEDEETDDDEDDDDPGRDNGKEKGDRRDKGLPEEPMVKKRKTGGGSNGVEQDEERWTRRVDRHTKDAAKGK